MIVTKKHLLNTLLLIIAIIFIPKSSNAIDNQNISKLKELYINTIIVNHGEPQTIIVAPSSKRYQTYVKIIHDQILKVSGVSIPIYDDHQVVPEEILKKYNIIVVGNMATNSFIEKMYNQWYTLLDLKYPGKGGYEVRSLHNPYGTGHNVIFVGGSDDKGVEKAANLLAKIIQPGEPLQVGWLMKIQLAPGTKLPKIHNGSLAGTVNSWRDSYRKIGSKCTSAYAPATFFGWNPISIAGILYYMTGQKEYLEYFKTLAMPNPEHVPIENRTSEAFTDPLNPLVKNDHYRSHLVDCVYDLIEESPLLTDNERLFITNKLLQHQYEYDSNHTYSDNTSRHHLWHLLNIYTGSRYFYKYYPDAIWEHRLENVRHGFAAFINNPYWVTDDTLFWVSTSTEPIFEFFLLDGNKDFVRSGTAKVMMDALEILMTGEVLDEYNKFIPISLLHKAAYLLKDSRYNWMANQLGFDFDTFRIGQSYWPADTIPIKQPNDLVNRIAVFTLAKHDWARTNGKISQQEGFQMLSYRTGLSAKDDFFLVDGFFGSGTNPYHLNTIRNLRMFNGLNILNGPQNDIDIWVNGMSDKDVAIAASLKDALSTSDVVYMKTEVPNMPGSAWQRYLLYIKDIAFVAIDKIVAQKAGTFNIVCSWETGEKSVIRNNSSRSVLFTNNTRLISAEIPIKKVTENILHEEFYGPLHKGENISFANLFTSELSQTSLNKINGDTFSITGLRTSFLHLGNYASESMNIFADFIYIDEEQILLAGATELMLGGEVFFKSDLPVTFCWKLNTSLFKIFASKPCRLKLNAEGLQDPAMVKSGETIFSKAIPHPNVKNAVADLLANLDEKTALPAPARVESNVEANKDIVDWQPKWELELSEKIINITNSEFPKTDGVWVASSNDKNASHITKVSFDGTLLESIQCEGKILSFWSARTRAQGDAFAVLAGFKDDTLRAYSKDAKELWRIKAEIDPSFKTGDIYYAPWFTDPGGEYINTGIYSILVDDLWANGKEEIAIGRPCTVEFRSLQGTLNRRVPTQWGTNTSLAIFPTNKVRKNGRVLLVGKQPSGWPYPSVINSSYANIGDNMYQKLPPGFTSMAAWNQNGLSHIAVADLDNNGQDDIIMNLSGHWNELRVYNGDSNEPKWVQYLGPAEKEHGLMTGLAVLDVYGNGLCEVIVGMRNGWICAFDHDGKPLWQHHFDGEINCMKSAKQIGSTVIGLSNGEIVLINGNGKIIHTGRLRSSIQSILIADDYIFAGTEDGVLTKLNIN